MIGRYENNNDTKDTFTHFPLILCNRARVQESGYAWLLLLTVWFLGMGAAASIAMHTVVSHAYVKRNHVVLWLLAALTGCSVAGTLADALSIGGPTGIRSQSRAASWLASLRVVVIMPFQVIFGAFFIWLCCSPTDMLLKCVLCNQAW